MLSEKFLDEMWSKCYWTHNLVDGKMPWPGNVTINSDQLSSLVGEIKTLTAQVKNPMVTSLWDKPMGYWIELEKSISNWEYPSGLAWHNWELKEENKQLQDKLTEAININTEMRRSIDQCREILG